MPHSQGLSNIYILCRIKLILCTYTYLKSNLILSFHLPLGLPKGLFPILVGLPVKSTPTFFQPQSSTFIHPDYIRWTAQTMKILILESSPLPILSFLGIDINLLLKCSFNITTTILMVYKTLSDEIHI
jgi:hypothetical protein